QRALLFIVGGAGVVDGVVEPESQFNRYRLCGKVTRAIEFHQAFGNMTRSVVIAMTPGIVRVQDLEPCAPIALGSGFLPERGPAFAIQGAHGWRSSRRL